MKGKLFGLIPYDLEPPTLNKIRQRLWDPSSNEIVRPTVFGLGWSLNLAALKRRYPVLFWLLVAGAGGWALRRLVR
jgi:hypothetical protein